jgi:hypothetical protein
MHLLIDINLFSLSPQNLIIQNSSTSLKKRDIEESNLDRNNSGK